MASNYRTPLPGILAVMLETAINRILALDDQSGERLERLDDRMLRLDLEGVGITLFFGFSGRRVDVGTASEFEPDTTISGSRNGFTPLVLWYAIRSLGIEGMKLRTENSLATAAYAEQQLNDIGIPAWRNPQALTVVFPAPPASGRCDTGVCPPGGH